MNIFSSTSFSFITTLKDNDMKENLFYECNNKENKVRKKERDKMQLERKHVYV